MDIKERLKQKIKEIPKDCGVPVREMIAAVYAIFAHDYGKEAVGDIQDYMNRAPGYWTKDRCKAEAAKYKTRKAWEDAVKPAYNRASKNGWLDECCAHMEDVRKKNGYWNLERCKEDAKKYSSRSEWRKSTSAYTAACLNGWIGICCEHMGTKEVKPYRFWDKEAYLEDAKKHKTRNSWRTDNGSGYAAAHKFGWLEECCSHMPDRNYKPNGYWTLETCALEAKRFSTRGAWQRESKGSYLAAFRKGWVEACSKHMENAKNAS